MDPYANSKEVLNEYRIELRQKPAGTYDAIIVAVALREYRLMKEEDFINVLVDVKGLCAHSVNKLEYCSL